MPLVINIEENTGILEKVKNCSTKQNMGVAPAMKHEGEGIMWWCFTSDIVKTD